MPAGPISRWGRSLYELTPADTARIRYLIDKSDLDGVYFHEQSARRHDDSAEFKNLEGSNVEVGIQFRLSSEDFGVRLRAEVQNAIGSAAVTVSGEYSLTDGYVPERRDVMMFANEVAVMTIYPFLREGVADATLKVFGEAIVLPIAPRGAIGFDIEE